ncbi:MAG: Gfo/Idh/MocA family oxidoreductase [Armatimonadetes bacterium]|nr:Gfo/Idh/MocA family oxidoreductase [Armatimonadota bacterium]
MNPVRTAIVGCGSVSGPYLADLTQSPYVEMVSVCDHRMERAARRAEEFGIPYHFDNVDALLEGPPFDYLINLTSMQTHFSVNQKALQAGKHVLSEKPLAGALEEGRRLLEIAKEKGVRFWGAPAVVISPAFRCMAEAIGSGKIGRAAQAYGRYGHPGPGWGPWFYQKGGGSLFDLGVYNITFLTGLLGPVKSVSALMGTVIPERFVEGQQVKVEADDNTLVLLDHGNAVFSCVGTGFTFGPYREEATVEVIGTRGSVNLLGWDWQPSGVEVLTADGRACLCEDQQGYKWERGGTHLAECLATGQETLMTPEHAYHVLEIMLAANESSRSGSRIGIESAFPWPLVAVGAEEGAEAAPEGMDPDRHRR